MTKKLTHEEFLQRVKNSPNGNEYEVLSKYDGSSVHIKMKHKTCGHIYYVTPSVFLHLGRRCPNCKGGVKYTEEKFLEKFHQYKRSKEYKLIGHYVNNHTPIKAIHIPCGNIVQFVPRNFFNGDGFCKKCTGLEKLTTEEVKKKIKESPEGKEYKVYGEYKNNKTKMKFFHKECKNYFWMIPRSFYKKNGNRCPFCKSSKGEKVIAKFLKKNNIDYKAHVKFDNCRYKNKLEFDFQIFLEDNSFVLVEFNGSLHYKTWDDSEGAKQHLKEQQTRDRIKQKFCKDNNIDLIIIETLEEDKFKKTFLGYFDF